MTTTRISHTGHDHPNTTAARTACRKQMAGFKAAVARIDVHANLGPDPRLAVVVPMMTPKTGWHCESCGSEDYEDIMFGDQGYSACCNEPVVHPKQCHLGCYHK